MLPKRRHASSGPPSTCRRRRRAVRAPPLPASFLISTHRLCPLLPLQRLPEFDGDMAKLAAEAEAAGECLRYVGVVDVRAGKGSVELRRYPKVASPSLALGFAMVGGCR